jgi:N-acetylglutamate synthase-like GNAT family acetyltransferase
MPPVTGASLQVRPARSSDLPGLLALVDRCSFDTLYRRFHGAGPSTVRRELERVAAPTYEHRSWVATDGTFIRGVATLALGRDGAAEVGFLVEDAWFRRGVGRRLFRAVASDANAMDLEAVVAWVQPDNATARRFLRAMAPSARTRFAGMGELEVVLPIRTVDPGSTSWRETA